MEQIALTIDEVVEAGGPCRAKIYEEIRDGKLRAVKIGRSTRILRDDLQAYFAALPAIKPRELPPQVDPQPKVADVKPTNLVTLERDDAPRGTRHRSRRRRGRAHVLAPLK
jgi:excisionase family DNA binding protein